MCGPAGNCRGGAGGDGGGGINSFSKYIENPTVETFETIHHFLTAATASSIYCSCRGTSTPVITMEWQNDGTSVDSGAPVTIACGTGDNSDTSLGGDPTFDVGSDLDLVISATSGNTTDCIFIIYFE